MQISELNAREAIDMICAEENADTLLKWLDEEKEGKNRKTVIFEIENAIEQFEDEDEAPTPIKEVEKPTVKNVSPKTKLNRVSGKNRKRL